MAIWQFRLVLIPETALRSKYGTVPVSIPQDLAEDFSWWSGVQPPAGFEAKVDAILPKASSWSEEMRFWGEERGDTIVICYDNEKKHRVEEIGFRVDVRELSPGFVGDICRLARELGCVLLTGTYYLIPPDEQSVFAAINNSTAKKYLEDPVSTLRSLKPTKGEIIRLPEKANDSDVPPKAEQK